MGVRGERGVRGGGGWTDTLIIMLAGKMSSLSSEITLRVIVQTVQKSFLQWRGFTY